jgi:hypothetical protein
VQRDGDARIAEHLPVGYADRPIREVAVGGEHVEGQSLLDEVTSGANVAELGEHSRGSDHPN